MPPKEKQELAFSFTLDDTNTIIEALGHLPYMRTHGLIEKINLQVQEQAMTLKQPKATRTKKK